MPLKDIAKNFVTARRSAAALADYPGTIPSVLDESYFIQDQAIALWDKPVIGWKIGRLAPERQAEHGTERLAGPIFQPMFKPYHGEPVHVPVFEHGFAAVEAEYVFRIGKDAPVAKTDYTEAEALDLIDAMFAGIEMAGSPLPTINKLGPTVVASDFGNNFGLILGPQLMAFDETSTIGDLDENAVKAFRATTEIDGHVVGQGGLFTMPGGPLKAIGWLAGHLARRQKPLRKGQLISSGATTGIHDILIGQAATVRFDSPNLSPTELKLQTYRLESDGPELA
ncbi:2-keto-4-pentenoate hydratase [Asticcacaulis endophyticus]|uniref:2-keto-4-pentenoate hydratase n=1 Tax=Asticcacaulis endophyticus TaxID=1395890 RepID=A0A918PTL1_9CAUL|nr:2-keto-4-pentenoate hydratase [Asticcacaulis endophyticus]GGZ22329.1 2-keto-4-pentenoate hydratase [Asticcacaulis endophyticus]